MRLCILDQPFLFASSAMGMLFTANRQTPVLSRRPAPGGEKRSKGLGQLGDCFAVDSDLMVMASGTNERRVWSENSFDWCRLVMVRKDFRFNWRLLWR
jgi:hypothetical protein